MAVLVKNAGEVERARRARGGCGLGLGGGGEEEEEREGCSESWENESCHGVFGWSGVVVYWDDGGFMGERESERERAYVGMSWLGSNCGLK